MDSIQLLKEFARSQGIDVKKVDEFLAKQNKVETIGELMGLPTDMLNHVEYISWVQEPLKSFIKEKIHWDRYKVIDLERVAMRLDDAKADAEDDEELKLYEKIEQQVIDTKFGSVTMDW